MDSRQNKENSEKLKDTSVLDSDSIFEDFSSNSGLNSFLSDNFDFTNSEEIIHDINSSFETFLTSQPNTINSDSSKRFKSDSLSRGDVSSIIREPSKPHDDTGNSLMDMFKISNPSRTQLNKNQDKPNGNVILKEIQQQNLETDFLATLFKSLSSEIVDEETVNEQDKTISFTKLKEILDEEHLKIETTTNCINEVITINKPLVDDKNMHKTHEIVESEFETATNRKITIKTENIDQKIMQFSDGMFLNTKENTIKIPFSEFNNPQIATGNHDFQKNVIESGFMNAKNQKIVINADNINHEVLYNIEETVESDLLKTHNKKTMVMNKLSIMESNNNLNERNTLNNMIKDGGFIESGFKTANNKTIVIKEENIDSKLFQLNHDNVEYNLSHLNTPINEPNIDKIPTLCEKTLFKSEMIYPVDNNNSFSNDPNLKVMENRHDELDSGFKTASNKEIMISKTNINQTIFQEALNTDTFRNIISKEPKTDIKNSNYQIGEINNECYVANSNTGLQSTSNLTNGFDEAGSIASKLKVPKHFPMRRYNCPQSGHISTEIKDDMRMENIYKKAKQHFKKEEEQCIFNSFKWIWMHLFVNNNLESLTLEKDIISLMKLRLSSEFSILRRIVEFDDSPFRFMILGILEINPEFVVLYDGFYPVKFQIDRNISNLLKISNADLGSKLYVFGASLLIKSATSIFELVSPPLELHYNGIRLCNDNSNLGLCKKISFLNKLSRLRSDGGIISALILKIKRIVEYKYLFIYENYRNHVNNIESEYERLEKYAKTANFIIDSQKIQIKRYAKLIMFDDSGECLTTWWSPPEFKCNDIYKFIHISPVSQSMGLHLSVTAKTYFEKMNK